MDKQAISADLAQKLRALRKRSGLDHQSLSDVIQQRYGIAISKDSLKNYETGPNHSKSGTNMAMRLEYLCCLADFYGVPVEYLLTPGNENWLHGEDEQAAGRYTGLHPGALGLLSFDDQCVTNTINSVCDDKNSRADFFLLCSTLERIKKLNTTEYESASQRKRELIEQCYGYELLCRKAPAYKEALGFIAKLEKEEFAELLKEAHNGKHTEG